MYLVLSTIRGPQGLPHIWIGIWKLKDNERNGFIFNDATRTPISMYAYIYYVPQKGLFDF